MLGLDDDNQPIYQVVWRKPVRRRWWLLAAMAFMVFTFLGLFVRYQSILSKQQQLEVRFYTQNIRFDNQNLDKGEQPWLERKHQLIRSIEINAGTATQPVVVGLQEVLYNQLQDVLAELNRHDLGKWLYFGKGRDDGEHGGEFAPVLYQPRQWKVKDKQVYWLLPTPDRPSKGWDAALNRVVTVVTLTLKIQPMVTIKVLVTHFDHKGEEARRHAASFIGDIMTNSTEPAFLLGDLNTEPDDEPYKVLHLLGLRDSKKLAGKYAFGEKYTYTGFNHAKEENTLIDYIWAPHLAFYRSSLGEGEVEQSARDEVEVELQRFGVLANYYQGQYFSDHRPVVADYRITSTLFGNN
ncbi:endonuclease/exonuclease/phosphatase family protein [Kocuria palustris]|nr:endonuclease/exonuclease/phosphatase family protein [Kocuria palustris]